jgi:hypothetical protein
LTEYASKSQADSAIESSSDSQPAQILQSNSIVRAAALVHLEQVCSCASYVTNPIQPAGNSCVQYFAVHVLDVRLGTNHITCMAEAAEICYDVGQLCQLSDKLLCGEQVVVADFDVL